LINEVDADGSGEIEMDEFLALIEKELYGQDWATEEYEASYALFDADQHGTISATQLKKVFENLGETVTEQEVREMIRFADKDQDGLLTFDEFCDVMK
jgi:Ca2+-binding EF-hand superfamily protein